MVCKQFQETVHHSFSSWFWSAPVIRKRQKGTLWKTDEMRLDRGQKVQDNVSRDNKTKPGLTQDPASCGYHRREGMKAAVLHEASTHEDT